MLACRTIGPVRVCRGSQLTNVNATAKAKFVDSAKSVEVSSILPMTSVHVELIVEGGAVIGHRSRRYACRSCTSPGGLAVMALSVVVLPSSDDEAVFP